MESILRFSGVTVVCHAAATEPEKQCGETARERANQVAVSHHSRIRCGAEDIIDLADQRRAPYFRAATTVFAQQEHKYRDQQTGKTEKVEHDVRKECRAA